MSYAAHRELSANLAELGQRMEVLLAEHASLVQQIIRGAAQFRRRRATVAAAAARLRDNHAVFFLRSCLRHCRDESPTASIELLWLRDAVLAIRTRERRRRRVGPGASPERQETPLADGAHRALPRVKAEHVDADAPGRCGRGVRRSVAAQSA